MTKTKKPAAHIKITSRRGHIRPHVRIGWLDFDGALALGVIVIILALRMIRAAFKILRPWSTRLASLAGHLVGHLVGIVGHRAGLIYLAFRAFYVP